MDNHSLSPMAAGLVGSQAEVWRDHLRRQIAAPFEGTAPETRMSEVAERCTTSLAAEMTSLIRDGTMMPSELSRLKATAWAGREGRSLVFRLRVAGENGSGQWNSGPIAEIQPSSSYLITGVVPRTAGGYFAFLPSRSGAGKVLEIPAESLVLVPLTHKPCDVIVSAEPGATAAGTTVAAGAPSARVINAETVVEWAKGSWACSLGEAEVAQANIGYAMASLERGLRSLSKLHDQPQRPSRFEHALKVETYKLRVGARTIFHSAREEYIPCPAWTIFIDDGKDSWPIASSYTHGHRLAGDRNAPPPIGPRAISPVLSVPFAAEPPPPEPMDWTHPSSSSSSPLSSPDRDISPPPDIGGPSRAMAMELPELDTAMGGTAEAITSAPKRRVAGQEVGLRYKKTAERGPLRNTYKLSGKVVVMSSDELVEFRRLLGQDGKTLPFRTRARDDDVFLAEEHGLGEWHRMLKAGSKDAHKPYARPAPQDVALTVRAGDTAHSITSRYNELLKTRMPTWDEVKGWTHFRTSGDQGYYDKCVELSNEQGLESLKRTLAGGSDKRLFAPGTMIVPAVCLFTEGNRRSILVHTWRIYASEDDDRKEAIAESHADKGHLPTLLRKNRDDVADPSV